MFSGRESGDDITKVFEDWSHIGVVMGNNDKYHSRTTTYILVRAMSEY